MKTPRIGSHPDRCLEHRGAKVIWDGAPAPSLRGMRLRLSVAPGFDGVMDVAGVANPVAHGETLRRKVTPSLLLRLGAPDPWPVEAVAGGVTAAPPTYGTCTSERSQLEVAVSRTTGERGVAPRCQALSLLLESDMEELLRLI
jgi:hypothetical protein